MTLSMAQNIQRKKSWPFCGRLIILQGMNTDPIHGPASSANYDGYAAINFPSMPEVIELARQADYEVKTPIGTPDGIHTYVGTQVLEIPLSFKLHSFDQEYCPQGALTLLQVAGALESLVLPLKAGSTTVPAGSTQQATPLLQNNGQTQPGQVKSATPSAPDGTTSAVQQNASVGSQSGTAASPPSAYATYSPATCLLELIRTDTGGPGVVCVGYVKAVSVKLYGPFLRGPGNSQNLPSRGEFSFTFVHHPGHSNRGISSGSGSPQAYAQTVLANLYNTAALISDSDSSENQWRGYDD